MIALEGLEFHAFHGAHPEEGVIGNRFTVDVSVLADMQGAVESDDLSGTVDYGIIYGIVSEVMKERVKLLEHLCGKIITRVFAECPTVEEITVAVAKANPPVGGLAKHSKITLTQTRK